MIGSPSRDNGAIGSLIRTVRLNDWEISNCPCSTLLTNGEGEELLQRQGSLPSPHFRFDEDNSHQHTFAREANRRYIDHAASFLLEDMGAWDI
jgi:hypothetical protein